MAKKVILICVVLFFAGISNELLCLDLVRNLNQEFLLYSDEHKSLLPITDPSINSNVVYLRISASEISNHQLLIQSKRDIYLYVDCKLVKHLYAGQNWFIPASYINRQISKDHVFLSFYSQFANTLNIQLYRNSFSPSLTKVSDTSKENFYANFSEKLERKNKYIIGILLSLFTFILLRSLVPDIYQRIFRLKVDMSSLMDRSSSKLTYFQNESFFIFLFISILAGIYIYVFLDKDAYVSGFKVFGRTYGAALFTYGLLGTFLLFFIKYIIYRIVSYVFGVASFSKILINEFSKTIFQSILFIYPLYFIVHSPYYQIESNAMLKFVYPIILVLSIFILKELYYFYSLFNLNKFYIIAYICICDLFPTCVFLKILSQSEFI